jgi:hypothetical protein
MTREAGYEAPCHLKYAEKGFSPQGDCQTSRTALKLLSSIWMGISWRSKYGVNI